MRILLFNEIPRTIKVSEAMFSSPLWGFLYLIEQSKAIEDAYQFSSPSWGFLYLMLFKTGNALSYKAFSSPRWGFLYLIIHNGKKPQAHKVFSSPHWGFFI